MKKITLIIGVIFMALAVFCSWMQATYYGYVDGQGVIHDSLFLPLSFIFGFLGIVTLFVALVLMLVSRFQQASTT